MCGRFALGAAHIDFLEGLQGQYARLFPGRGGEDGRVRGGGPQRLRGGGAGGEREEVKAEVKDESATEPATGAASGSQPASASASDAAFGSQPLAQERPTYPVADKLGVTWEREQDFWPSYNIAPRQRAPVVRRNPSNGEVMIETMQWGLIPHWTKFPPTGALNTINARSEALIDPSSGGMWHALKGYKRCVIPAQGYYEWQKKGSTKVAHFTRLPLSDGTEASAPPLLFFAGLWDTVKYEAPVASKFVPKEGDDREPFPTGNPVPLSTFTILTTTPSPDIAWLHDRMPCVLTDEDEIARWLDLGDVHGWEEGKGGTADLLHGFKGLTAYPVVPEVGKIGRSEPNYILPVAERKDGIKSFFQKAVVKSEAKPKVDDKPKIEDKVEDVKRHVETEWKANAGISQTTINSEEDKPDFKPSASAANPHPEVIVIDSDNDDAPPSSKQPVPTSTPSKRKRDDKPAGGRQTKIVRQKPEEKKQQPSITSFFKSPKKP